MMMIMMMMLLLWCLLRSAVVKVLTSRRYQDGVHRLCMVPMTSNTITNEMHSDHCQKSALSSGPESLSLVDLPN